MSAQAKEGMKSAGPQVIVIQRVLTHYRVGFFRRLKASLRQKSVNLKVISGQASSSVMPGSIRMEEDWALTVQNRYWHLGALEICWQPCLELVRGADLVIVEQANRLLINYILQINRLFGGPQLAFWGHGANLQAVHRRNTRERLKAAMLPFVDWWFAYTDLSAQLVKRAGYPQERITTVQNAIDTRELEMAMGAVSETEILQLRTRLGLAGKSVAVFCGGMYADKLLDFLVEACVVIRRHVPDFEIVFIGGGPDQHIVEVACAFHPWMHYVGPVFGRDRAKYFAMSRLLLMPGLVGLAIVDSFITACPIFTTNVTFHSPEVAYLEHGKNGWMTETNVDAYAAAVVRFFSDTQLQEKLVAGCRSSAAIYTIDNMVSRFTDGVLRCLQTTGRL
jgi:glycosyltransferase involved in cell wall biosynthesis